MDLFDLLKPKYCNNIFIWWSCAFFPTRYFLRLSRKYIHISYENSIEIAKDIQRVVDNLFLIKILRTNKIEIKNFRKVANNFTTAQLKITINMEQLIVFSQTF